MRASADVPSRRSDRSYGGNGSNQYSYVNEIPSRAMLTDIIRLGFEFVLLFGLFILLCFLMTFLLLVIGGLKVSTRGTGLGVAMAILIGGAVYIGTEEFMFLLIVGILSMVFGLGAGRVLWPGADAPSFVYRPTYRIVMVAAALAGIGAGLGLWILVLATAGPSLLTELAREHPGGVATLFATACAPMITGLAVIYSIRSSAAPAAAIEPHH